MFDKGHGEDGSRDEWDGSHTGRLEEAGVLPEVRGDTLERVKGSFNSKSNCYYSAVRSITGDLVAQRG